MLETGLSSVFSRSSNATLIVCGIANAYVCMKRLMSSDA
jgi:hypothetical protein